jgi:Zn-dependent peptidase ImmA (M78 family)/DNA-binding XRE family transcriptional regulator
MSSEAARSYAAIFDRSRLKLARAFKAMTKTELAELVDVSATAITQYETGASKPSPAVLSAIADALGQPVEFFGLDGAEYDDLDLQNANFRSLRTTRAMDRAQATARAYLVSLIVEQMKRFVRFPQLALPDHLRVSDNDDRTIIEKRAAQLRKAWDIPPGPIVNVVRLLESKGVIVTRCSIACKNVHAFSKVFHTGPIVVLDSDKENIDRLRFDAAHELGHLVMHPDVDPGNRIHEIQANQFAAALLMPEADINSELPSRLDYMRFYRLKQRWRVSMQALIRRARDLGNLSDSTYRRAMMQLSQRGQRTTESLYPLQGEPERSIVLTRAMNLIEKQGVTVAELARRARLLEDFVAETVFDDELPAIRI